jgi:DNA-binding transcriptional regulator YbjK
MPTTPQEFSEDELTELLRALYARASASPENPGLIASWPGVREDQMSAACAELLRRGHRVFRLSIPRAKSGSSRDGWALRTAT